MRPSAKVRNEMDHDARMEAMVKKSTTKKKDDVELGPLAQSVYAWRMHRRCWDAHQQPS